MKNKIEISAAILLIIFTSFMTGSIFGYTQKNYEPHDYISLKITIDGIIIFFATIGSGLIGYLGGKKAGDIQLAIYNDQKTHENTLRTITTIRILYTYYNSSINTVNKIKAMIFSANQYIKKEDCDFKLLYKYIADNTIDSIDKHEKIPSKDILSATKEAQALTLQIDMKFEVILNQAKIIRAMSEPEAIVYDPGKIIDAEFTKMNDHILVIDNTIKLIKKLTSDYAKA